MISYSKAGELRIEYSAAPEFPFWHRSWLAPYSSWASKNIRIDLASLSAREAGRLEIAVCPESTLGAISRSQSPVVVDATGFPETMFRRGAEILDRLPTGTATNFLVSANGRIPPTLPKGAITTIVAWPSDVEMLSSLCVSARQAGAWGLAIPILHPVTTDLDLLDELTTTARRNGASFCAAIPIEAEPSARKILASEGRPLSGEEYEALFQDGLETIIVATERHIAAIAASFGMKDSIPIPGDSKTSNWEAAASLARCATRMIRMSRDLDLGWELIRSAAAITRLDAPLTSIAASASLAIIEPLNELAIQALEQWLTSKRADFFDEVDEHWRLMRR